MPIRDTVPSRYAPVVTWWLIAINSVVFLFEITLGPGELERLVYLFGIVPARFTHADWAIWRGLSLDDCWPFLTSMFLHGSWSHIIGNMMRAIELTDPQVPLDIVLHTPGGFVLTATEIARAVRKHQGKVAVFVPHYAMSGGTLIALAADEIVMSPHAVLGPVDPQLGKFPAASLLKVVAKKPIAEVDDETPILADVGEKALTQLRETATELLGRSLSSEQAGRLTQLLATGTWTHDYPITIDEGQRLGLKVRSDMPGEFLELMSLYPQPVRRQPSVEYLPVRRHADRAPAPAGALS